MARNKIRDAGASCRKSVFFVTLGCAKNEVDTRDMQRLLMDAGYQVAESIDRCDAVVVNTCSFIKPAIEESIDAFFETAGCEPVAGRGIPVIVAGCMPSRFGSDLEGELVEAAAFVPCSKEGDIVRVVGDCIAAAEAARDGGADADVPAEGAPFVDHAAEGSLVETCEPARFAYVKISDGCDRFCSYCTIPYIRGRYHSFPYEEVESDVRRAISEGAREVVLIGQDTGLWGSDFDEPSCLAELLSRLAEAFPDVWFRAMYTQPENVTPQLLDAIAGHGNVAPYLDIPLQHVVPRILDAMNRKGSREEFLEMIAETRRKVPGIALRTTFIAGFPGETNEDFEELVSFVEAAEFDYVGVFPYSREEGTRASSLPDQVNEDEKAYRAERLRTVADAVSASVVSERAGREIPVLVEGEEEDCQLFGRAIVQAPEVDGVTYVDAGEPGEVRQAVVEDALMYDMEAHVL